jgi:hypothetical protein
VKGVSIGGEGNAFPTYLPRMSSCLFDADRSRACGTRDQTNTNQQSNIRLSALRCLVPPFPAAVCSAFSMVVCLILSASCVFCRQSSDIEPRVFVVAGLSVSPYECLMVSPGIPSGGAPRERAVGARPVGPGRTSKDAPPTPPPKFSQKIY